MANDSLRDSLKDVYKSFTDNQAETKWDLSEKQTHPGLWLEKYLPEQSAEDTKDRAKHIKTVARITPGESDLYNEFYYKEWVATLKDYDACTCEFKVDRRLIVGLGSESILETSIALHRTYGVPYIPGSAIKGLATHYVHSYLGNAIKAKGKEKEYMTILFGNTEEAGYITYFDALYVPDSGATGSGDKRQALHPDIITVHHPEYYRNKPETPPADWDSPTPIPFLTATGNFLFALAAPGIAKEVRKKWIDITFTILTGALQTMGIGAKTSSGYGRMSPKKPEEKEQQK
jgi:CRISPR-associated protein Cmr6